jgi:hypothetical protein
MWLPRRAEFPALAGAAVLVLGWPMRAGADTPRDPSTAEALFLAGRSLMEKGDFAAACPKFAESDRLDPAAGTLINLADCEEHLGRLAPAWEHWKEAVEMLPADDARLPIIKNRAAAVERRVPRLTLKLAPGTPADVSIKRDDVEVGIGALNVALPEDPGEHLIVVSAPGHMAKSFSVTMEEGQSRELVLEAGAMEVPPPPPSGEARERQRDAGPAGQWMRPTGFALGAVGIGGLGVSAVTGILAIGKKNEESSQCYPAKVCTSAGADAASSGRTLATVSTLSFVVGVAALGTGVVFVLLGPKRSSTTAVSVWPQLFLDGAGVGMARNF